MRVTTSRVTDNTVGFDRLRAVVGAGDGVVARFPGIVCVARCSDPEPLRELLAVCAEEAGPEPGRALARRLATWMTGPDAPGPELRFGTVAAAGERLAVYLVGEVDARVDTAGGLALSGAHAAIGTDRLLPHPSAPLVLSMDGGAVRTDPADVHDLRVGVVPGAGVVLRAADVGEDDIGHAAEAALGGPEWFDTGEATPSPFADPPAAGVPAQRPADARESGRNGAPRAAGLEASREAPGAQPSLALHPGPDPGPATGDGRPADEPTAGPAFSDALNGGGRHALPAPTVPPQAKTAGPDPQPDHPLGEPAGRTPPLPDAPSPGPTEAEPAPGGPADGAATGDFLFQPGTERAPSGRGPRIRGYRCENGHLNDPRSSSCRDCGAPIDERVGGLVAGPRPVLGTLLFDDGAAHPVDRDYLLGRTPDGDERVRAGELRPIALDDEAGSVSAAHAEIRVSGWDVMVVDVGSHGATYVSGPGDGQWTPLAPRRSRRLLPGTRVRLGGRMFVFESPLTVR